MGKTTQLKTKAKQLTLPIREIPNTNSISAFMHCDRCLKEKPADLSPREWASLECGWTKLGFQVWCKRHEANVIHMDFQGQQHPANVTRHEKQPRH